MDNYNFQKIEKKWQGVWEKEKLYQPDLKAGKNPFYNLMMFPYPSAEGMHVGNMYAFTGSDIYGRFKRMQGFDVFEPIGLDGFGIHSENYAISIKEHPLKVVKRTEKNFYQQLQATGNSYAWDNKLETYNPDYYKWTQWIFLQLFKKGLVQRKKADVNWCSSCKTVLADEQVIDGKCERCDTEIVQKQMEQWFFKITDYAERLEKNLEKIDWSEEVKKIQKNWIGRSEGASIKFEIQNPKSEINSKSQILNFKQFIEVFTTRADTLFGATFMVLSPEHPLVDKITINSKKAEIKKYQEQTKKKSEIERTDPVKEKTGVFTGSYAINPVNNEKIPIWIADYVLMSYGYGAIMAVPAHDQRDLEFAKKYNLPIKKVIQPRPLQGISRNSKEIAAGGPTELIIENYAWEGAGILINSEQFNGMDSKNALEKIIKWLSKKQCAKKAVNYRLRDWLISRQRYWGPPIPIIYCDKCGIVPVPEKDLPVLLPEVKNFRPTGTDKSPLATVDEFINTKCPLCKADAKRESDVSDNFLDSAWYFLRYPSVNLQNSDQVPFDKKITKKWLPVDMYIGGKEHSVLHLMYTRFIVMALYDMGYLDFEEPFKKFRAHGVITKNRAKMAKSRGNVVNPDEYIQKYGADCFRMYLMFLGPYDKGGDFSDKGISGIERFLKKVWFLKERVISKKICSKNLDILLHQTIKKVTDDIENLKYNTAISALMVLASEMEKQDSLPITHYSLFLILLAPFAPHLAEEIWQKLGNSKSIFLEKWPKHNPKLIKEEAFYLVVQINGKLRDTIGAPVGISEKQAKKLALKSVKVQKWLENKKIRKIIFIPDKLINIVI